MFYIKNIQITLLSIAIYSFASIIFTWSSQATAADISGNARILVGHKSLKSNDWFTADGQDEVGLLLDFQGENWPVSIAVDIFAAGSDTDFSEAEFKTGYTAEFDVGLRKTFTPANSQYHPYIGAGLAIISGGLERRASMGGGKTDDSTVGIWLGAGAYWNLTEQINLGFDLRYSNGETTVFNNNLEAGGTHAGITLGYNW